jgi:hypothetical protein
MASGGREAYDEAPSFPMKSWASDLGVDPGTARGPKLHCENIASQRALVSTHVAVTSLGGSLEGGGVCPGSRAGPNEVPRAWRSSLLLL